MVLLGAATASYSGAKPCSDVEFWRRAILASATFFFEASCCLSGGGLIPARGRKLKLHSMAAAILTYKVLPSGYKDVLKRPQKRVLKCEVWI